MKPYRFLEEADSEFQEHIAYFDGQASGLGDKYVDYVGTAVSTIRQFPEIGAPVSRNLRKWVLRAFKHNLSYVNARDEIIIVALAPHKRRPGYWRKRLKTLR